MILETNNGEKLKKEYSEAFGKYCSDHKIVSEFIRFHPIFQNYLDVDDSYDVIFSRHTVGTDLEDYDDPVQKEFAKSLRRDNRRALEKGVTVKLLLSPYILEGQLHYKGEIIASELYFTAGNILHAHLLGSSKKMLELNAGGLLEAAAAKWGKEHGFRYIHHGGGRSSDPNDALFQYKKKFGKNTEFDFYIGKKIWNKDVYDMLVEKRMECGLIEDVSYFPLYRAKIKE